MTHHFNHRIGIIGTGNVAWHLASLFFGAGIDNTVILVRNEGAATVKGLGDLFNALLVDRIEQLTEQADMVIIAVNDAHVPAVAANLSAFKGLVCHTSGTVSLKILADQCRSAGVFYPLQSLTKGHKLPPSEIPFCIEANTEAETRLLESLALTIGSPVFRINSEQRRTLHVAAVIVNNFTNHLFTLAKQILNDQYIDFDLLSPLMVETVNKAIASNPLLAQTGPAVRGDQGTILNHLELLQRYPGIAKIYEEISLSITQHNNQ